MFDIIVMVSSLLVYHWTLSSYSVALNELRTLDAAQIWLSNLRIAVIQLNAPGNDVFESRNVAEERDRFDKARTRYHALVQRDGEFGVDLSSFRANLAQMVTEAERIFDAFAAAAIGPSGVADRGHLDVATAHMAAMDRYQAGALDSINLAAMALSEKQHNLLAGYGTALERSAAIEKYLFATVGVMLLGVFWYGRKLQQTHEQLIAEQQLAVEEKHKRLAAVGEVCSSVSHGIRNPLAAITSSAQLVLEYGTLDETTRLRIRDILHESRRLNDRVTRLLNFSNSRKISLERCDLNEIIRSAIHEIQPKLDQSRICVDFDAGNGDLFINGDKEWIAQAVIEVVSNSMDHMPGGGDVSITCQRQTHQSCFAQIDIVDSGPGIPENIRPHVFDLFFTSKPDGTGIGLASVKRAVEMHGGNVAVAPTNGRGARIEISLPLVD